MLIIAGHLRIDPAARDRYLELLAFRTSGGPAPDLPELLSADVRKYRISAVEAP